MLSGNKGSRRRPRGKGNVCKGKEIIMRKPCEKYNNAFKNVSEDEVQERQE